MSFSGSTSVHFWVKRYSGDLRIGGIEQETSRFFCERVIE